MNTDIILDDIGTHICKDIETLFTEVILKTPIKTGAARASHKLVDMPFNIKETSYKTYSYKELKSYLLKDKLSLISNCPYIGKLESGFSNQAPFGFYNIALLNFKNKYGV